MLIIGSHVRHLAEDLLRSPHGEKKYSTTFRKGSILKRQWNSMFFTVCIIIEYGAQTKCEKEGKTVLVDFQKNYLKK